MTTNYRNEAIKHDDKFELMPFRSQHTSKEAVRNCNLTVVNTPNNGKRITFASELLEKIKAAETVRLAFYHDGIAIGRELPGVRAPLYTLKKSGKKGVVYCGGLVEEVTELFGLDFEGRTSMSFHDVEYLSIENVPVAIVKLRSDEAQDQEAVITSTTVLMGAQAEASFESEEEETGKQVESVQNDDDEGEE